jgi:small conductance mechanosensitive channel
MPGQAEVSLFFGTQWGKFTLIAIFYLAAWIIHRLAGRLANRFVSMSRFAPRNPRLRYERVETLHALVAGVVTFIAFVAATLFSLGQFIDTETLIWMIGLFSAAFGLAARPLVSDFLAGVSFIFEDTFEVGEKVEMPVVPGGTIEGVIEAVYLRTTLIRAPSGELFTIPNGEVRVVRNFSRGRFSAADVELKLAAEDLGEALPILEKLGHEAMHLLPNLLEPWQVISKYGEMGQQTELTLLAKARFGKAAELRPRLLALVQEHLAEADIQLVG